MRIREVVVARTLWPAIAAIMLLAASGCSGGREPIAVSNPQRLVSLAPSVTETLFALGLGDRVVGVTRYCDYPPEALSRPQVGGYLDPSYETIVSLVPDRVFLIQDHDGSRRRLAQLGISTLQVDHDTVAGILESITSIANDCGEGERGLELRQSLEDRLRAVAATIPSGTLPRVLVAVGRTAGSGSVTSVWVAGPGAFYDDVLSLAGAANACDEGLVPYPELSREGIAYLDPDVIVDIQPRLEQQGLDSATVAADWQALLEVRAVRQGRVEVMTADFMEIPGPRVVDAVEALAEAIHGVSR